MRRWGRFVAATASVTGLALGAATARASWSESRAIPGVPATAGDLDLSAGAWESGTLTLTDMIPGESIARTVRVSNSGNVNLRYTTTVTTAGTLATSLQVTLTYAAAAGAATNTGTAAAGNRTGGCTGSGATSRLTPGTGEYACVVVRLDPAAPPAMAGQSGTVTLTFDATNPAAP